MDYIAEISNAIVTLAERVRARLLHLTRAKGLVTTCVHRCCGARPKKVFPRDDFTPWADVWRLPA